uniref:Uncharacterized protein n=1 Tax=Cuerna arida TaxID=1464854 RepID=A0A1B6GKA2_9HEMI
MGKYDDKSEKGTNGVSHLLLFRLVDTGGYDVVHCDDHLDLFWREGTDDGGDILPGLDVCQDVALLGDDGLDHPAVGSLLGELLSSTRSTNWRPARISRK